MLKVENFLAILGCRIFLEWKIWALCTIAIIPRGANSGELCGYYRCRLQRHLAIEPSKHRLAGEITDNNDTYHMLMMMMKSSHNDNYHMFDVLELLQKENLPDKLPLHFRAAVCLETCRFFTIEFLYFCILYFYLHWVCPEIWFIWSWSWFIADDDQVKCEDVDDYHLQW